WWDWGDLMDAPFLPRVVYGRLVLSPAQWRIEPAELETLRRAALTASRAATDEALAAAREIELSEMRALRAARQLPRWVMCGDGDNILTVDLTSAPCIESLLHLARGQPRVRLYELSDTPEQQCARGGEAAYVHELVIPWLRTAPPVHRPTRFR